MANDNHEYYNSEEISTYTDPITISNPMTADAVYGCVLSAGVPYDRSSTAWIKKDITTALNEPNSNGPWENGPSGVGVVHDTSELIDIPTDNLENYFHVMYRSGAGGAVTALSVKKYRNVVAINPNTTTIYGNTITYYTWTITTQYGDEEAEDWTNSTLSPFRVINISGDPCLISMSGDSQNIYGNSEFSAFGGRFCIGSYINTASGTTGATVTPLNAPYVKASDWDYEMVSETDYKIYNDAYTTRYLYAVNYGGGGGFHAYGAILITNIDYILMLAAICGLKFEYNGVIYKPIVSGGVVTGYTDDMTEESEWDEWENIGDHDIPDDPTPVPPPPGPGYEDDPWNGVSFSGVQVGGIGAFARCYYMTSTELQNLRSWMASTSVPEGFDPMAQIIGLSQVPVALSGDDSENIQFINSSAVYDPGVTSRVVDSGVSSQYSMGVPKRYSLGSVNITRRMQERGEPYLDYSCQVELYLPLVGVFSLDTQAIMGRTLSADAILDPVSGTLAAYAWVEKDGQKLPVAYGSTTIGVDLPVTAQQYSVAKAALKQANAQLGTSLLSSALTMIASASASGKAASGGGRSGATVSSGIQPANNYNPYSQAASLAASQTMLSQTGNVFGSFMDWGRTIRQLSYGNNTAIAGSFCGSAAQWSYPFEAYVKIIRPRFEKPTNYNHSQGVPCVKSMTVGRCTGLIQCIGADVSGITRATDLERQAIQAALTNGVFAGGGQS